jgi:hypothetical protein
MNAKAEALEFALACASAYVERAHVHTDETLARERARVQVLREMMAEANTGTRIDNHDLGLFGGGRMVTTTVRVHLAQWDYTKTVDVKIHTNFSGFCIMDSAVEKVYDDLLPKGDHPKVVLTRPNGDTLECEDEDAVGVDWLRAMVVGVEIVGVVAKAKAVRK